VHIFPVSLLLAATLASPAAAVSPTALYSVRIEPIGLEAGETVRVVVMQRGTPLRVQEISSPLEFPVPADQVVGVFVEAPGAGKEVFVSCLRASTAGEKRAGTTGIGGRIQVILAPEPRLYAGSW
jgi:hypothetical protein